jgi:hypothetical protein
METRSLCGSLPGFASRAPKDTNMKTWVGLALIILPLLVGCAPGYYEPAPAYQQSSPKFYTNPETTEEYERRIWWESMRP